MNTSAQRGGRRWPYLLAVFVLIVAYVSWTSLRQLPTLQPQLAASLHTQTTASQLVWPKQGQVAVGVVGTSIADIHGAQSPAPIASVAKVITALTILREKPLSSGQPGPMITLTDQDVALYNSYAAQAGSVVKVQAGEQITQYQMLQTIMLPSANNMADSLATWAFGSLNAYANAANRYLAQLGLRSSHVGVDASGLSPTTTSTAHDLVRLGEQAMQNPVLAEIASQETASGIPVVGNIKNVNYLLGGNNIVGIKTGNSDPAGGVFLGASRTIVANKPVTIVTALVGAPNLFTAMKDSQILIKSAQANFQSVAILKSGQIVGNYKLPWGGNVSAVASKDFNITVWKGSTVSANSSLKKITADAKSGQSVGTINISKSVSANQTSVTAKLQQSPTKPSIWWRLSHPV